MLPTGVRRRRFDTEEYHRMVDAEVLSEDDRVELIEGEIVEMTPIGARHVNCVNRLTRALSRYAGDDYLVSVQNPLRLDEDNEPQPDLALLRESDDPGELPTAADVALVVEVAETSLRYDRETKLPLYAKAGIPEVWLLDLNGETVEVYSAPGSSGYTRVERYGHGQELRSESLPDLALDVDNALGR